MLQRDWYLFLLLISTLGACQYANAQTPLQNAGTNYLKKRADALMTLTGFSLTPDVTTGNLKVTNSDGKADLQTTSLGGGDRISANFPLYIEGTLAFNRYNPTFTDGVGNSSVNIPMYWNSITGTGGIGWDFPITDQLRFRPIANVMLGHLESDASVATRYINNNRDVNLQFINSGRMNSYGAGGSVMLDYENYKPDQEIDIELRYTNIAIQTFASSAAVQGSADSQSLSLWARSRIPTPWMALDRPIRAVFEAANTQYLGNLRGAMGFNSISSVGTGIEIDRSASDPIFSRVRVVVRYRFGQNVQGTSIGLAASF
ncbi:autotransporter domain-containing protein [Polynucleobacter sp.]|jgi:hypothetical protein|uniref:autotransporter domain-containing protein n=1 Tax=Polynucleobacter sp. TaxID=2029855 RepID=UPI0037C98208